MWVKNAIFGLLIAIFISTSPVTAQTPTLDAPQLAIINALNDETKIYEAYGKFAERIGEISPEVVQDEFRSNNMYWRSSFSKISLIYGKYASDMSIDQEIREIAQTALKGNDKAVEATEYFERYTDGYLSTDDMNDEIQSGVVLMQEAGALHDETVDMLNDYSGYTSSINTLYLVYGLFILATIASILLWMKSKTKSMYDADVAKTKIYGDLFGNSMWMTLGLAITAGTLHYATINGGSYYILYGPVLVGGWKMIQGLTKYFSTDRKLLDDLKRQKQEELMSSTINL